MADLFPDHLEFTRSYLSKAHGAKLDVPEQRCFTGWNAYADLLKIKEIDLVILATPPAFRPIHLAAAVAAGKHVFVEKPVAVDARRSLRPEDGRRSEEEEPDAGFRSLLALRHGHARDLQAHPRQGFSATSSRCNVPTTPAVLWNVRAGAELDRHGMAMPQLALLHLALRRPQCRAAHP